MTVNEPAREPNSSAGSAFESHAEEWGAAVSRVTEEVPRREDFEALRVRLSSRDVDERIAAVGQLAGFGACSFEPLCLTLKDSDKRVRAAAANGLAELGDIRAIGPLTEALRACFLRRSGWWHLFAGIGAVAVVIAVAVGSIVTLDGMALYVLTSGGFGDLLHARERRGELVQAITKALIRIGERSPSPELRGVLPDLQIVAMDVVQQSGRSRATSRVAAERIRQLTEKLKDLPVASNAPDLDPGELPRPSNQNDSGSVPTRDERC